MCVVELDARIKSQAYDTLVYLMGPTMASNRHIHLELEFALHAMEHIHMIEDLNVYKEADFLIVRININSRGWKNCDRL